MYSTLYDMVNEYLLETIAGQFGLATLKQLNAAGVSKSSVMGYANRGTLTKVAYGVYRLSAFPSEEFEDYMLAILWAQGRGVIVDQSALVLWDLCDVNPREIHLGIPKSYRPRKAINPLYCLHKLDYDSFVFGKHLNIPVMQPYDAISRCIDSGMRSDLLNQAIETAYSLRHLSDLDKSRLTVQLEDGVKI